MVIELLPVRAGEMTWSSSLMGKAGSEAPERAASGPALSLEACGGGCGGERGLLGRSRPRGAAPAKRRALPLAGRPRTGASARVGQTRSTTAGDARRAFRSSPGAWAHSPGAASPTASAVWEPARPLQGSRGPRFLHCAHSVFYLERGASAVERKPRTVGKRAPTFSGAAPPRAGCEKLREAARSAGGFGGAPVGLRGKGAVAPARPLGCLPYDAFVFSRNTKSRLCVLHQARSSVMCRWKRPGSWIND